MSGILSYLEPEELVGSRWHRLTEGRSSARHYPTAKATFEEVSGSLAVFFRGLGGEHAIKLAETVATTSHHRLSFGLKIMLGQEKLFLARRDGQTLLLPPEIDVFEQPDLNRKLYFWLAAFFAYMPPCESNIGDPLMRDIDFLRRVYLTTSILCRDYPGLAAYFAKVGPMLALQRSDRHLRGDETHIERAIGAILTGSADGGRFWPVITGAKSLENIRAAKGYSPFLPVPFWGDAVAGEAAGIQHNGEAAVPGKATETQDSRIRSAQREEADQTERKDYLALNRYEKLLSLVESLNINRGVDDDDEEGASKAFEDSEDLQLSNHSRAAATRLKVELDIASGQVDSEPSTTANWPEWDYKLKAFRKNYCTIIAQPAAETGEIRDIDPASRRRIAKIRKQFDALRPRPETQRGEADGPELDLDALIRSRVELATTGTGSDRVYITNLRRKRDISVGILVDTSLSTDSWLNGHRVLDVEKEALLALTNALTACGDNHAIYGFSSRRRHGVNIATIKDFAENAPQKVERRINALKPGEYTRIGAAIRYSAKHLADQPHQQKLLLVVTDGKPNDVDHYEGRYGIEDTRHAILEARGQGLTVFGITVDAKAQDYFPVLFGRGGYAIVGSAERLPSACLAIYRRLTSTS